MSDTRSYYGVSSYIRLFPFLAKEVGEPVTDSLYEGGHYGYFGQWMGPYARTNHDPTQANQPSYRGSASTASIEGGLFSAAKMGKTKYPKYLAGSSTHAYTPWSDVGRGWGFYESAIDCTYLGLVYMSNRLLVPPSGISYEPSQPEHADDGGIFVGAAWLGLPIFHATKPRTDEWAKTTPPDLERNVEEPPMLSWAHVIDTAQVRGPVIAYAPEMFTRRWKEWCEFRDGQDQSFDWQLNATTMGGKCLNPSLKYTLGLSGADWSPSLGGEFNSIKSIFHDFTGGNPQGTQSSELPTHWKLPHFNYPTGQQKEPYLLDPRTYSKGAYNRLVHLFSPNASSSKSDFASPGATNVAAASFHMSSNPTSEPKFRVRYRDASGQQTDIEMDTPMTVSREYVQTASSGSDSDSTETNIFYEWKGAKKWSRYAKTVQRDSGLRLEAIDETEAPEAMKRLEYTSGLKGRAAYTPHAQHASSSFDASCFECTNSAVCEQQVRTVTVESGAVVSYRWWRWRDQPAMTALTREFPESYTDEYLSFMQERIEWMHELWDGTATHDDKFFLKRPEALTNLAELEHALVLSQPPAGVPAHGWVPVALSELFPPEAMVNGAATNGGFHETLW